MSGFRVSAILLALVLAAGLAPVLAGAEWREISPGLELGAFDMNRAGRPVKLTAVRVDPARWDLGLFCLSEQGTEIGRTAAEWCEAMDLVAAINAGMYATDYRTHVGYLRNGKHVNSLHRNAYKSVAAFRPKRPGTPPFRIADLDAPGASLDSLIARYHCVVQNLRLIKRERENRWQPQPRKWSEAALAEDSKGRALLLLCSTPMTVHEFNERLLALPLDVVCAQHLEGGPQAQLAFRGDGTTQEWLGTFESGGGEGGGFAWKIPNVIGVKRRK
jgi:hypothetical protein